MTAVQLEPWQLITLLMAFLGFVFGAGKLLLGQIDKRLDSRFDGMEKAREEHTRHWDAKFKAVLDEQQRDTQARLNLERDFLKFRGDLPLEYVRREDFIRNQSVIEAKLDAVALHIQNLQLQRVKND